MSPGYSTNTPVSPRGNFSTDAPAQFRRPFGCAVLELAQLSKMAADESDISSTREHTMPIFVPTNEALFSMLHQDIIANNSKEYEKSPRYTPFIYSFRISSLTTLLQSRDVGSLSENIPWGCKDYRSRKLFASARHTTHSPTWFS
jgi:hypothetical protein